MQSVLRQTKEEEKHLYGRGKNVTISSGTEAVLCIPGLKSRFYIRGMEIFSEIAEEECLYRNWQRIGTDEFTMSPGDILTLGRLQIFRNILVRF